MRSDGSLTPFGNQADSLIVTLESLCFLGFGSLEMAIVSRVAIGKEIDDTLPEGWRSALCGLIAGGVVIRLGEVLRLNRNFKGWRGPDGRWLGPRTVRRLKSAFGD
jgi:hypothetical protein